MVIVTVLVPVVQVVVWANREIEDLAERCGGTRDIVSLSRGRTAGLAIAVLVSLIGKLLAASLHFEGHFRVDAIAFDLATIYGGGEFFHVDRTNVAQRLGGLACHILGCIFPTFRRFRHHLDDFDDFCHNFGSFPCLYRGSEWSRLLFSRIEPLARWRGAEASRLRDF